MRNVEELTGWHADWAGLRVVVLGIGVTGFSVADTLIECGADVLTISSFGGGERALLLDAIGGRLVIEPDPEIVPQDLTDFGAELVIVSPGYRPDHAIVRWARAAAIPIWGDIELAWRLRDKVGPPAEWVLVTGTNGKTTTVQLAAHMLAVAGCRVAAVGNIGIPVLDAIRHPDGWDVLIVELSSFQLHWMPSTGFGAVHPLASACLNLADDHLDWHGSREAYFEAKAAVYENTRVACVYNRADSATRSMVEAADVHEGCRAIGFGFDAPGPSDLGMVDGVLVDRAFHEDRYNAGYELSDIDELQQVGLSAPHLVANVLAASALVRACGVSIEHIHDALMSFEMDHHRTEVVAVSLGISWIDDSKATNPHAADASLTAFPSVIWIVGGLLKGVDLTDLVANHLSRLKAVVVIGADRADLCAVFARHAPDVPLFEVDATETGQVMPEAVRFAVAVAGEGDTVLLAPAAASMDQFTDYADRGTRFAAAVRDHLGGTGDDYPPTFGAPGETNGT